MLIKGFAVFDVKAGNFAPPFFMPSVGLAVRAFTDLVNDVRSTVNKYPGDFTLFQVGEFDDVKGIFIPLAHNVNLGLALEFVKVAPPAPMLPGMDSVLRTVTHPIDGKPMEVKR